MLLCLLSSGDADVGEDRENSVKGEDEPFQPSVPDAFVKTSDQQDPGIKTILSGLFISSTK